MANIITAGNSTNGGTSVTTDTSGTLNIVTGSGSGATAIAVDTSQNVGIGTTTPNSKLSVETSSSSTSLLAAFANFPIYLRNTSSTDNNWAGILWQDAGGTNSSYIANTYISQSADTSALTFGTNNGSGSTERMRIDSSGGLILVGSTAQKATGTTWSNPSDKRLKNNIRDYTKGTAELMQVRVKEWEYNGKGGTIDGTKGIGVIADEIMTVLPNTVENYNAKLNSDDEETTEIKKFDATEITWLLVKTVQELKAELDAVKAKVGV